MLPDGYDLLCILGPTASGKTRYAVQLARELDGGHALFARVHIVRGELLTSKDYAGDHEQEVAESVE